MSFKSAIFEATILLSLFLARSFDDGDDDDD